MYTQQHHEGLLWALRHACHVWCVLVQEQKDIDEDVFAELWRFRSGREGVERSVDDIISAIAAVLHKQLNAGLPVEQHRGHIVSAAVTNTSATVQKLLNSYKHVFLPREKCTDVATHVRAPSPRSTSQRFAIQGCEHSLTTCAQTGTRLLRWITRGACWRTFACVQCGRTSCSSAVGESWVQAVCLTTAFVQVVVVRPGVFAAVIALEAPGVCMPVSVRVQPHSVDESSRIELWSNEQADLNTIWHLLSQQASSALAFFLNRVCTSHEVYPGESTLSTIPL